MSEKELILRIKAASDAAGFDKVKDHLRSIGDVATKAGKIVATGMLAGSLAVAGVGAAAVHSAGTFQTQMKQVETLGADFGRPFREVEADVSNLATTMGLDAVNAATTLYNAVSAGVPPGNALEFMEAAAKAAVGGAADLDAVGSAMSVAMNSWGAAAGGALDITDGLFQVVKMGVTTVPELAANLGQASGIAAAAGVSFNEYGAALAQITTKGKTTSVASTQLKGILSEIMTPTSKATAAFIEMGYANGQAAIEALGFQGALQLLEQKAASAGQPITALFGSVEAGGAALDLTGSNTQAFTDKLTGMNSAAGNTEAALAKVNEGWERQVELLQSQASGALRDIGMAALPTVTAGLSSLNDWLGTTKAVLAGDLQPAMSDAESSFLGIGGQIQGSTVPALDGVQQMLLDVRGALDVAKQGFVDARDQGAGVFEAALLGLAGAAGNLGLDGLQGQLQALADKWVEVAAAFEEGGVVGALSEVAGFDLQPAIDTVLALGGAVVDLGGFLLEHKGTVLLAAGAYLVFKGALAINQQVENAKTVLSGMKAVWLAYKAGTLGATLATTGFGAALKLAMGPIGWIIMAVGLLAAAWATNFLGIRDKTQPVIDFIKGIPAMIGGAFTSIVDGISQMAREWKAKWDGLSDGTKALVRGLLMIFFPIPMLFTQTGRNMIMGLWNGIKAIWTSVVSWLKSAADKLPDPIKKALRMASPSRVFYQLGYWIMEGLALGIGAGGRLARTAMDDALAELLAFDQSGQIEAARQHVRDLGNEIMAARNEFLSGGAGEPGSLASLFAEGRLPDIDLRAMFEGLQIPAGDIAEFQALLEWLVSEGEYEKAQGLWEQFFDAIKAHAEDAHQQRLRHIEDEAKARAADFEITKRRIAELIVDRERQAKESGWPETPKIEGMGDEIAAITRQYADILALLGHEGTDALHRFYEAMTGGAVANITTNEDLTKALELLGTAIAKHYEDLKQGETDTHNAAIAMLSERARLIDVLIAKQQLAEEDLQALIAHREELLARAREAIKASQEAAEERENRVHDGVMKAIAAQRKAWTEVHNTRMQNLERQRQREEDFHSAIIQNLQDQRSKIGEEFAAREKAIDQMRADLDQLKMDLRVEDALAELVRLKDELNEIQRIMGTFEVQARGREDLERQRKAQTERVRATTDEQRAILERARDSGLLSQDQLRTVNMLLLGYKQRATDVAEIFAIVERSIQGQVDAQQEVVNTNQREIDAATRRIEDAETLLSIDKTRAQVQIDDIDRRIKAEEDRWKTESARLDSAINAEKERFEAQMAYLDEAEQRQADAHAQRMADIAAEHALLLAGLGMSQEEIAGIIAEAQRLAQSIADETEALFQRIMEKAPGTGADPIIVGNEGGSIVGKGIPRRPEPPPPGIGPGEGGRGSGGIRKPGGQGAVVVDGGASITEGTIERVEMGAPKVDVGSIVVRLPSGRELLAELIETLDGDVVLTDKLGRVLNERGAQSTP